MRVDLLPKDRAGKLEHIVEECSEVIKAICKLKKFGAIARDPVTGIEYNNTNDLLGEFHDLQHAIQAFLECP